MSSRSVIVCLCLLSCLLLPFGIGCDSDPLSPDGEGKVSTPDSAEIVDYPRWPFGSLPVDALPVSSRYVPGSRYAGISIPKSGTCHYLPTHVYRWNDSAPVRLDIWLTTRCAPHTQPVGNYDRLRIFFDTRKDSSLQSTRYPDSHYVHIRAEGREGATEKSLVIGRGVTDYIEDPSGKCYSPPPRWLVASTKMLPIPMLWTCRDSGIGDTLHLTLTFDQPFLSDSARSAPEVSLLVFELIDTRNGIAVRVPFYFYAGKE